MHVVGSTIARLGSKHLKNKNLMSFEGKPLVGFGIEKLWMADLVDKIAVSTESELIARVVLDFGAMVLERPSELAGYEVPSIPVFQHLTTHFLCDLLVNSNVDFPLCQPGIIDRAVELARANGKVLSNPFAAWALTSEFLDTYGDQRKISAHNNEFEDERAGDIDNHTLEDLLKTYRLKQWEYPKIYLTSPGLNPFKKRGYPVDKHLTRLPSRFARERPRTI